MKKNTFLLNTLIIAISFSITSCNNEADEAKTPSTESNYTKNNSSKLITSEDSVSYAIGADFGRQVSADFKDFNEQVFEKGLNGQLTNNHELIIEPALRQQLLQSFFMQLQLAGDSITNSGSISNSSEINSMEDTISYILGVNFGENFTNQFPEFNATIFLNGLKNRLHKTEAPLIDSVTAPKIIQAFFQKKQESARSEELKQSEKIKSDGILFLEQNKNKKGVITTETGLQYIVMKEGTGQQPTTTSNVTVHYHGTTPEGIVFDSSVDRGEPATFGLDQVIKGWTEGVALMKEGAKYRFFIPQELAYGANPRPGGPIKPYMPLVFEVELLKIN